MLRIILIFLILVGAIAFGLQNHSDTVTITFLPGVRSDLVPVYILALGSFVVGMAASILMMLPMWMRDKLELRKQRKSLSRAEDELSQMRNIKAKNQETPGVRG
jgi:uncharacterized membrane protein YciS (DUF1049 family)